MHIKIIHMIEFVPCQVQLVLSLCLKSILMQSNVIYLVANVCNNACQYNHNKLLCTHIKQPTLSQSNKHSDSERVEELGNISTSRSWGNISTSRSWGNKSSTGNIIWIVSYHTDMIYDLIRSFKNLIFPVTLEWEIWCK